MAKHRNLLNASIITRSHHEVAEGLGLTSAIENKGWADMPTKDLGRIGGTIGGNMVKVMIRHAEASLSDAPKSTEKPLF
ncbi:MAG: alpha/beta-type small acid-soluble spore protein [Firmicutes bacterium]|nr:alpha/beta-type small acid-soluble spore protein [Bacillota bacterium]